jgi:hypothetical protein
VPPPNELWGAVGVHNENPVSSIGKREISECGGLPPLWLRGGLAPRMKSGIPSFGKYVMRRKGEPLRRNSGGKPPHSKIYVTPELGTLLVNFTRDSSLLLMSESLSRNPGAFQQPVKPEKFQSRKIFFTRVDMKQKARYALD